MLNGKCFLFALGIWLSLDSLQGGAHSSNVLDVVGLDSRQTLGCTEVFVSAAISMTEVLQDIVGQYEQTNEKRVILNLASSNTLATQIIQGAPADLFVSADTFQMDRVWAAGRIVTGSRVDLVSNQLVIVIPDNRSRVFRSPFDLLSPDIRRIAIGDPSGVPAGVYARRYLAGRGLWRQIREKVVPTMSVRGALSAVEGGHVDAGIVYRTDVVNERGVIISLAIPPKDTPDIVYQAAVMKDASSEADTRHFLSYLQGPESIAVFEQAGFITLVGRD